MYGVDFELLSDMQLHGFIDNIERNTCNFCK